MQVKTERQKKTRSTGYDIAEDVAIAKAYCSATENPVKGKDQRASTFWNDVFDRYCKNYEEDNKDADVCMDVRNVRTADSIKNRWQRYIMPGVNQFNGFYKRIREKDPTGNRTIDHYMELAMENYLQTVGQPFKFKEAALILHQINKFNPMIDTPDEDEDDDEEGGDKKRKANTLGKAMGEGMERPVGQKKAKHQQKSLSSVASLQESRTAGINALTESNSRLADVIELKEKHDTWMKMARMCLDLGDREGAKEYMDKIKYENV